MIRLIVSVASRVCRVESTRWPVSAAESAVRDGLLVAHLADQDHVGVLAQDAAHRAGEALGVGADLALVDDRALVAVQVLDRVLERDDVPRAGRVDVVDHRRERRRLARAGGAGQQDDPARLLGELADHLGQAEVVDRPHLVGDRAADDRDVAALAEGVDAEARHALELVGEVGLAVLGELARRASWSLRAHQVLERALGVLAPSALGALDGHELAVDPRHDGGEGTFTWRSEPSRSTT